MIFILLQFLNKPCNSTYINILFYLPYYVGSNLHKTVPLIKIFNIIVYMYVNVYGGSFYLMMINRVIIHLQKKFPVYLNQNLNNSVCIDLFKINYWFSTCCH